MGEAIGRSLPGPIPFAPARPIMGVARDYMVAVAQLVRALLCESRGRGFESRQPPIFSFKNAKI